MDVKIPDVGESVREALVAKWFKKNGDVVRLDEPVCEIETDKITLDLNAAAAGFLTISVLEGTTVAVGTVIGAIEESIATREVPVAVSAAKLAVKLVEPSSSPSLRREMREHNISPDEVVGSGRGGRITQDDLLARIKEKANMPPASRPAEVGEPVADMSELKYLTPLPEAQVGVPLSAAPVVAEQAEPFTVRTEEAPVYSPLREERLPMSLLRKRADELPVAVHQQAVILTTFNEVDLSHVKALCSTSRECFIQRHGLALGFMPFFVKASIEALKTFPLVNASIDGDDIVCHHWYDIAIAVGGDNGLVLPVLRAADQLKMYEIDQAIAAFSEKIKNNHLANNDLEGGTFTISNSGVYGSMFSTPALTFPQSAALGMHAIQDRPVVREGNVVIRPMMYLALSYVHRIIDSCEAVGFLKKVKEYIEDPEELLLEG